MMAFLQVAALVLGGLVLAVVVALCFWDEICTLIAGKSATLRHPAILPYASVYVSDRVLGMIPGRQWAHTSGYNVWISSRMLRLRRTDPREFSRILHHEMSHVMDRRRYGRFYIHVWLYRYLRHGGYGHHPDEVRADAYAEKRVR